ncbi:hypothetical protein O3S80_03870 [Streptomyces sp. Lzd4kr]|nr:hypothetical protein [Streptomyces sp. Lzd4kr]
MAKITRHGGASDATLPTAESAAVAEPEPTPAATADQPEPEVEAEALDVTEALVAPPEPVVEESDEPAPTREQPDYEALTVEELKEQLAERGLPKSGKRDDLVLRLLEDDDTRTRQDTE